ncbi:G-protein coupled receptor 4-like [Discoglossus pictus]
MWSSKGDEHQYSLPNESTIGNNCSLNLSSYSPLFIVTYSLSIIVGVPTNLIALYGTYQLFKSRSIQPIYLLNLGAADLLYLCTLPLWIIYFIQNHHWLLGSLACKISGAMYFINMYASIYFLCCIALDRYLGIMYPMRFQALKSLKCHITVSLVGWLVIIICQIPLNMSIDFQHSNLCYQWIAESRSNPRLTCAVAIFGFVGPLFILCFSYQASIRRIQNASVSSSDAVWIKALLMACLFTFVLCFGPYHCISLIYGIHLLIYGHSCDFDLSIYSYYRVSVALTSLNTVLDPLMYIYINGDFRKQVKNICRCDSKHIA